MKNSSLRNHTDPIYNVFEISYELDQNSNMPQVEKIEIYIKLANSNHPEKHYNISIYFQGETHKIRRALQKISADVSRSQKLGIECLETNNKDDFYNVLQYIHTITPLSPGVLYQLIENKIEVSFLLHKNKVIEYASNGKLANALTLAQTAFSDGEHDIYIHLANYYQQADDINCYSQVLQAIPAEAGEQYIVANSQLHILHLNMEEAGILKCNASESLQRKFKYTFNANLAEANLYFNELCGYPLGSSMINIMDFKKSDSVDAFIKLALLLHAANKKALPVDIDDEIKNTCCRLS